MAVDYDIIIRGGTIIDGSGAPGFVGDVAVRGGVIAAVAARIEGSATEIIDARGLMVTPGFIDIHTHFDAQVSWDESLDPSASHGVTTVVMGNCGVGFAPVHKADHDVLIDIMEGVEDIPGAALHEGISWDWETFPEYLDAIGKRVFALDVAAQIPHAALRLYAMGERGASDQPANTDDIATMAAIVQAGLEAGAVGFSTSRLLEHQSVSGQPVPGTFAAEDELMALGGAVRRAGRGVFQAVPKGLIGGHAMPESANVVSGEFEMLARIALEMEIPVIFSLLQSRDEPLAWREALRVAEDVRKLGGELRPQVQARSPGVLSSLAGHHPFQRRETFLKLADLPFDALIDALRRPDVRSAIVSDADIPPESTAIMDNRHVLMRRAMPNFYLYSGNVDFEPTPDKTMSAIAAATGKSLEEAVYDALLEDGGRAFLFDLPFNYVKGDYSDVAEMLASPVTLVGLSDAGAHVRVICDGSMPTFHLSFWARDRKRGPTFPVEFMVKRQTSDNADVYGFADRGRIAVGLRADLNVIDFERLSLQLPQMVADLPKGGRRLLQAASGYVATLVAGVVTRRHDRDTGARPGRLVRDAGLHRAPRVRETGKTLASVA